MKTIISKNDKETKEIGQLLLEKYPTKKIFSLSGNLGSGKTTLTKGLAKSLGIKKTVTSPTFIILNIYNIKQDKTIKELIHIDAYRLKTKKDLENIGFFDFIKQKDCIIVIEWGNKIKKYLPKQTLNIKIVALKNNYRKITTKSTLKEYC